MASSLGAPASAPQVVAPWIADPESQYLLDVQIRQKVLGEGVRAYPVPGGTCLILGDLSAALDIPVVIDLKAGTARGWAFREENRLAIDRTAATVRFGKAQEALPATTIRDAPEGWCVDSAAVARWLGIGIEPRTEASVLLLQSEAKLPVELAVERRERAARLSQTRLNLDDLPRVRLPYRLWRSPSVDVMMDAGIAYQAGTGRRIDHRASIIAAGEALQMSYEARIGTDAKGLPTNLRLRAYRADPEAGLLGPLKATHVALGDVEGLASPLISGGATGRGAMVTNRPLIQPIAFDRTQLSGELPPGWDAELYRNGELVAFARGAADSRYRFDDVALTYGDNRFEILTFGPQGQVKSRIENVTVGPQAVPPGETHYWAGVVDPGRDLLDWRRSRRAPPGREAGLRAAASLEHGLDQRTSVAAVVQSLVVDDARVTYVEGSVRRSLGPAIAELAVARDSAGGLALRAQALARIGATSLSWSSFLSRDFAARPEGLGATAEHRLTVHSPLKLSPDFVLPLSGDLRLTEREGGGRTLELQGRTSVMLSRLNLSTLVRMRDTRAAASLPSTREVEAGLIASGRIGPVRVRGTTEWALSGGARLRRAELSGYWSRGGDADWEGAIGYEENRRVRARMTHIRRFDTLALAGTLEAASDGSVAAGLNLSFSLDSGRSGWRFSRQSLAATGSVRAQVFRDSNGNGTKDAGEQGEAGATITAGMRPADRPTGKDGWTSVAGLENYRGIAIGVDASSLSHPNLVPAKAAQLIVPRPGVSAEVLIPLVGGGAIEGTLAKDGGGAFEGLVVELVGENGKVAATASSDYDGYFLFERAAAGRYKLRLAESSRDAAGAATALLKEGLVLGEDQAVLRLGTVTVRAAATLAVNQNVVSGDLALAR